MAIPPNSESDSPLFALFHDRTLLDFVIPLLAGEMRLAPLSERTSQFSLILESRFSTSMSLVEVVGGSVREGLSNGDWGDEGEAASKG